MKTTVCLILCLALLPVVRVTADEKRDSKDPFVDFNNSLDATASSAFSEAVRRHAAGAAIPADMADAQARLDRRMAMLSAEAGREIKGNQLPAAVRSVEDTANSQAVAQNLDKQLAGLRTNPGPREFQELMNSLSEAGGAVNAGGATRGLNGEIRDIRNKVQQAVDEELASTIKTLEETSPPEPGSAAPK